MPNSLTVFHNQPMNISSEVNSNVLFKCTGCTWSGHVSELGLFLNFSCCPECYEYDVRVLNNDDF